MTTVLRGCVGAISSAAVITALQREGVRVVGMDSDPHSVGFRLCETSYHVLPPDDPGYIANILSICQGEAVDAILPSAEEEILVLGAQREVWEENGIELLCPPYWTSVKCADKRQTHRYFAETGIPFPTVWDTARISALLTNPSTLQTLFPCIVKPPMGRGGIGVFKVEDRHELAWRLAKDPDLIVQEYIEGDRWAVDTLMDWDGTILSMVTRRTILMQSGSTTKGVTERDDKAMGYARQIVRDLQLVGPSIIEYIRGPDGIEFLEVNTRFGGGAALWLEADPSVMPNLVRMIRGEAGVPSGGFTEGLEMLRYYQEVFTRTP